MKKETLVAIILGIAAGIGVAFVMIGKARESQMLSSNSISTSIQLTPSVATKNQQIQLLDITSPENESISSSKSVTIKGKGDEGGLLVVQSAVKNSVQKLDKADFTVEGFPLSLGENTIRLTLYPKNINLPPQEKELKIYYLDEQ
jgi:hypothetical protein